MPIGLEIEVKGGRGSKSLFHPEMPLTYIKGRFEIPINAGANANSFSYIWDCPVAPLNKPWFRWFNTGYARSLVVTPTGIEGQYKLTGERSIVFIDPRNGYIAWSGSGQPLIETATIEVWDLRG